MNPRCRRSEQVTFPAQRTQVLCHFHGGQCTEAADLECGACAAGRGKIGRDEITRL